MRIDDPHAAIDSAVSHGCDPLRAFVTARADPNAGASERVTCLRAFATRDLAQREATRLSALKSHRSAKVFVVPMVLCSAIDWDDLPPKRDHRSIRARLAGDHLEEVRTPTATDHYVRLWAPR